MTGTRSPGRYNLHRLGWSAFEDLCMQVMRVVLGETCSRFLPGMDGGRDGWFVGQAAGLLSTQSALTGSFVVQCKHTSSANRPLSAADLRKEVQSLTAIAARSPSHYVLMTNRQVSALSEKEIREAIEAIPGVGRCLVLNESWLEDTVDANPRLLRLVPRLYGIGDLSQILSFTLAQQTTAVLEDLAQSLRTFVPTDSYRRSEHALHQHGFVVLVGPPASGKSAIAANLCMVNLAQDADVRVMRIEHSEQFKETWSPADEHTIYWVDDVFGETTLDEARLREWSAALDKVEAARRRRARIIFCTRDYILTAAVRKLKKSKADLINDARVRVDVTALSPSERETIMYNHIKEGDIDREQKQRLKAHLSGLSTLGSFSPELARRLGSKRFHAGLKYSFEDLQAFFDRPVRHFRDVIHGLSGSETAALAVCLLSGNAVPDPVPDHALADVVLKTYNVSVTQVREALELLEGSLVKRVRQSTKQSWQVHHPSMIEALQEELASKSSQLVLYLEGALLSAIVRDTTTLPPPPDGRLVFLSETVYPLLSRRFDGASSTELEAVGEYLVTRASDGLLGSVDSAHSALIDRLLSTTAEPEGPDVSARLAARLLEAGLLTDRRREIVVEALTNSVLETGWLGFLEIDNIRDVVPGFVDALIAGELRANFLSLRTLYDWYSQDLSGAAHVDSALEAVAAHTTRLTDALAQSGLWTNENAAKLKEVEKRLVSRLDERGLEIEEQEDRRAEYLQDEWKEQRHEERYEMENSRFADVDE